MPHAKIYEVQDCDIAAELTCVDADDIVYRNVSDHESCVVYVLRQAARPRWLAVDVFRDTKHDLLVVYFNREHRLLFINSSIRIRISTSSWLNVTPRPPPRFLWPTLPRCSSASRILAS